MVQQERRKSLESCGLNFLRPWEPRRPRLHSYVRLCFCTATFTLPSTRNDMSLAVANCIWQLCDLKIRSAGGPPAFWMRTARFLSLKEFTEGETLSPRTAGLAHHTGHRRMNHQRCVYLSLRQYALQVMQGWLGGDLCTRL